MLALVALAVVAALSGQAEMSQGLAAEQAGDLAAARTHLETAARLLPNLGVAQVNLLDVLVRLEEKGPQVDQAIAAAQSMEPNNPRMWRLIGQEDELRGDATGASQAYEKAVGLRGDDKATRMRLGNLYRSQGRTDDALAQFRAASDLDPQDHLARLAVADALTAQGDLPDAEKELKTLVSEAPASPVYKQRLHDVQLKEGKKVKSDAPKRKLRALKPSWR